MRRRQFLATGASAAIAVPLLRRPSVTDARAGSVLVLGGTNYVGPAIVTEAMRRGHDVTLFNRGVTRPHLFPDLEKLRGVRAPGASDLATLEGGRRWDAVIDVWPEDRRIVDETVRLLRDRTDYYFYVSSIAVYGDYSRAGLDESSPVVSGPDGFYGAEKAAAERAIARAFPGRFGVARCPAILGPYDPAATYHYWLRRIATRDEVLCPGDGSDPIQTLDVRDLAVWALDSIEARRAGIHNLTGSWPPRSMREFLQSTRAGLGSDARLTWVDADFLRDDHGLRSFSDLPLWAPLDEDPGFYQISGEAALAAGARYRPPAETARASWDWFRSHFFKDVEFPHLGSGIAEEREDEILRAWHGQR